MSEGKKLRCTYKDSNIKNFIILINILKHESKHEVSVLLTSSYDVMRKRASP